MYDGSRGGLSCGANVGARKKRSSERRAGGGIARVVRAILAFGEALDAISRWKFRGAPPRWQWEGSLATFVGGFLGVLVCYLCLAVLGAVWIVVTGEGPAFLLFVSSLNDGYLSSIVVALMAGAGIVGLGLWWLLPRNKSSLLTLCARSFAVTILIGACLWILIAACVIAVLSFLGIRFALRLTGLT